MTLDRDLQRALKQDPIRYRVAVIADDPIAAIVGGGPRMEWYHEEAGVPYSAAAADEAEMTAAILNGAMTNEKGEASGFAFVLPYAGAAGAVARKAGEVESRKAKP